MKIQITPVQIFPNTATQIEFLAAEVQYGKSARAQYVLQDASGQNLSTAWASMTPEQYAGWTANDDYAVACFISILGLEVVTPLDVQLDAAVTEQRGAIATFEAEKTQYDQAKLDAIAAKEIEDAKAREVAANEAKALAEAAEAASKAAQEAASKAAADLEAENARVAAALAAKQAAEDAAKAKAAFDAAVAAAVAAQAVV